MQNYAIRFAEEVGFSCSDRLGRCLGCATPHDHAARSQKLWVLMLRQAGSLFRLCNPSRPCGSLAEAVGVHAQAGGVVVQAVQPLTTMRLACRSCGCSRAGSLFRLCNPSRPCGSLAEAVGAHARGRCSGCATLPDHHDHDHARCVVQLLLHMLFSVFGSIVPFVVIY
jgi:hypothetical protein